MYKLAHVVLGITWFASGMHIIEAVSAGNFGLLHLIGMFLCGTLFTLQIVLLLQDIYDER